MAHHPLNVFQHVTAAHMHQVVLAPLGSGVALGPGFKGFDPVLNGSALVFADFIQRVQ